MTERCWMPLHNTSLFLPNPFSTLPHHFDSNKHQYADRSGAVWALIGALVQGRVVDGKGGGSSLVDNSVRVSGLVVYE